AGAPGGAVARLGRYGEWRLEVEQLHRARAAPEQLLAQQGVDVHARQPLAFVLRRGGGTGLVIGDDQLAVRVELEPVDDAPQADAVDLGLDLELEPDAAYGGGVFEPEVVADQIGRLRVERGGLAVGQAQLDVVGIVSQLDRRLVEAGERRVERALARGEQG